jgi:hypothetical protein
MESPEFQILSEKLDTVINRLNTLSKEQGVTYYDSITKAAEGLGVTRPTIYGWINSGQISIQKNAKGKKQYYSNK